MSDRIKCPRCKQFAFTNARYSLIRDEFILFDGKCVNCEYEITAEALYEQLSNKFDLEKDFEHLEKPLDYILSKLKSTEEETRKKILEALIKICEEKTDKSLDVDQMENYLYKKINYEQILNGKKYSDEEIFSKLGNWFSTKGGIKERKDYFQKAAEYYEQAVGLDPTETAYQYGLWHSYRKIGEFDKALKHLEFWFELQSKQKSIVVLNLKSITEIPVSKEIEEYNLNDYLKSKGEILFKKGDYQKVIELLKGVNFTPEMVEHTCMWEILEIEGAKIDPATFSAKLNNEDVQRLLLRAYVKLGDLDNALRVYDKLITIDPECKELSSTFGFYDADDADDEFDFFCNVIFILLKKDINRAYELVRQIDIDQLKKDCDEKNSVEYAALVIFVSFLKATVYFDYFFAGGKKENQLLKEADKYFRISLSTLEELYLGGDLWINSWPPPEIWESYFGSTDNIQPEAHKLRGKIFDTLGDTEAAFVEYKRASEYEGYDNDENLKKKIEEAKLKLGGFAEKVLEKYFTMQKPVISEAERDVQNIISSALSSIKDIYPDIAEHFEKDVGTHGVYGSNILNMARKIMEKYLLEIEHQIGKPKATKVPFGGRRHPKEDFFIRVQWLKEFGHIDNYIQDLMLMVYAIGGPGSHEQENSTRSVKLRDLDFQLAVLAMCRFLRWYTDEYPWKKE